MYTNISHLRCHGSKLTYLDATHAMTYHPIVNLMPPLCLVHLLAHSVAADLPAATQHLVFPEVADVHPVSRSAVLFQVAALPSRVQPMNNTRKPAVNSSGPSAVVPSQEHVNLIAMAVAVSTKIAVALGVTDIISLCVLGLVVLLALYFVWGGSVDSLKENPYGELKQTGERAGREAQEKFQKWQQEQRQSPHHSGSEQGSYPGSPTGFAPARDPFATQGGESGFRRQFHGCCWVFQRASPACRERLAFCLTADSGVRGLANVCERCRLAAVARAHTNVSFGFARVKKMILMSVMADQAAWCIGDRTCSTVPQTEWCIPEKDQTETGSLVWILTQTYPNQSKWTHFTQLRLHTTAVLHHTHFCSRSSQSASCKQMLKSTALMRKIPTSPRH